MTNHLRYGLLRAVKLLTRAFYRHELIWIEKPEPVDWDDLRIVALLHHTSLFEWLFVGAAPNPLLRRVAHHALIPAADVTLDRLGIGTFLKLLAPEVLPITRQPDHTWDAVLRRIDRRKMVVILPEGRMMRANGLDKHGRPMTVRGGIADILQAMDSGSMLLAYSGGLHHVQIPGQGAPKLFRRIRVAIEWVDIADYNRRRGVGVAKPVEFKRAVVADLHRRRDHYCPQLAPERPSGRPEPLPASPTVEPH